MDIGSVSINTVICSSDGKLLEELPYLRHFGRTIELCEKSLSIIEKKLDREINTNFYSEEEFKQKRRKEDPFLEEILTDKIIFIKGTPNDL